MHCHTPPFIRTPYNYDLAEASRSSGLSCPEPTRTQQQFKDEVDINVLVARYGITGTMPQNPNVPGYGDFSGVFDYQTALNTIIAADRDFLTLPWDVRDRFANDPQKLLVFLENPHNRAEAIKLGLLPPQTPPVHPTPQPHQTNAPEAHPKAP